MIFQRIASRIAALQTVQTLTAAQHSQLQAVVPTTPTDAATLTNEAAAVAAGTVTTPSHPFLQLLSSYLSNPQQLVTLATEISTIVALFPK